MVTKVVKRNQRLDATLSTIVEDLQVVNLILWRKDLTANVMLLEALQVMATIALLQQPVLITLPSVIPMLTVFLQETTKANAGKC